MSERNEKEAGRLILSNFQMFNEAVLLFEKAIQPAILEAFDATVERECQGKLEGVFDFHEDEENKNTRFYMKQWLLPDSESPIAYFMLDYSADSPDGLYSLDDLCGLNGGMGFTFAVEHGEFGGKNAWNKFYKAQCVDISQSLTAKRFSDDRKRAALFLPFKLDVTLLTDAWGNDDYANLMQPVVEAMRVIIEALPLFEDLLGRAKKEFRS